jgi:translation initiation factor IF-3
VNIREALNTAKERDLDLVEVAPNAKPPVCKVMDYGKYKYQMSKRHTAKKTLDIKVVKIRPRIDEHDLQRKARSIRTFLDEGNRVKISLSFRGRERGRPDLGMKVFEKLQEILPGSFNIIQQPKHEGNTIIMSISPK